MKLIISILITSFFISCGSSQKKTLTDDEWLEQELGSLKNEDFLPEKEVQYKRGKDFHSIDDLVNDALADESLAKIDLEKIEKIDNELTRLVSYCYVGKFDEAKKFGDQIYGKYRRNPSYWNQIGSCFYFQRNIKKAKLFYRRAYNLNNRFVPAINNLGVIYILEGKDRKAQAAFEQALVIDKNANTPKYNLTNLYIRYGLFSKANSFINNLLTRGNKYDKDILLSQAYLYLYQNQPQQALNSLSKIEKKYLSRKRFALVLYFAYKKANDKKAEEIASFLAEQGLSPSEQNTFNRMRSL